MNCDADYYREQADTAKRAYDAITELLTIGNEWIDDACGQRGVGPRQRLFARLDRTGKGILPALMMLDIDLFKHINDTLGHQAGDTVIRKVAEILRRSVRVSDVGTRYGGDEFCVIVPENAATAPQTAERIRQRIESFRWDSLGLTQSLHVTVSIGVCIAEPGESTEALLGRADQNLYDAKARGRNCVSV